MIYWGQSEKVAEVVVWKEVAELIYEALPWSKVAFISSTTVYQDSEAD
jgi:hypothetical protein